MLASTLVALGVLAGCSRPEPARPDAPGTNLQVNDVKIRYAHLADAPSDDGYPAGADVPLYVWFVNDGAQPAAVTSILSPVAEAVRPSSGTLPVQLPPGRFVALGPRADRHLTLVGIRQRLRGAQFVPVTLGFTDGTTVTFDVEAIEVDVSEGDLLVPAATASAQP